MAMFLVECPNCYQKSFPGEKPPCIFCNYDADKDTGMGDYFNPTRQESAVSKHTEVASGARNLVPNNIETSRSALFHNRKRNESNGGMTTENNQAQKQPRPEILGISDEVLSPYCMSGSSNLDFVPEIIAETSHLLSDNSHPIAHYRDFLNVEEYRTYNKGMEEIGYMGEKRHININQNIASNISIHSLPFERPPLSYCSSYQGRYTGMGDNFQPTQPESAATIHTNVATWSRNLVPNYMKTGSTALVHNKKINESNDRVIAENIQIQKQPKQEIWGISEVFSPYWKLGSSNPGIMPEINEESSHLAFNNSHSINLYHEFLNFEDPQLFNQGMQKLECLGEKRPLNIRQNNMENIGIFKTFQNGKDLGRMPHFEECIENSAHSRDDKLAVPGPSNRSGNENVRNFCEKKLISTNPLGDEKAIICRICDREISKHVNTQSKNIYYCCVCQKSTLHEVNLQMHIDIHYPKKVCNVCKKEYTEWDLHESL